MGNNAEAEGSTIPQETLQSAPWMLVGENTQ